ncbi:MAG: hypothetical protein AAFR32_08995 [Pseudomonadota bacterium]
MDSLPQQRYAHPDQHFKGGECLAKYPIRLDDDARFMRLMGWIFLLITFGGFVPTYFIPLARGEFVTFNEWMHPHAIVSFVFAILFLAQPWLILERNWRWHKYIGWVLAALVAGAVITGVAVQLAAWPTVPEDNTNRSPASFRLFQLLPTLAGFFIAAVLLRKRQDWHWRLMFHAAYAPMGTAFGRFVRMVPDLPAGGGPVLSGLLLAGLVAFALSDKIRYGRVHSANWIGLAFYIATVPLSLWISNTDWFVQLSLGPNAP